MKSTPNYRLPGTGAIDFARPYVNNVSRDDASPIITKLIAGELHDATDKRIKRCAYCNFFFRDATKPNNAKTCCKPCKIAKDSLERSIKNADKELLSPTKRKTLVEKFYYSHLEYSFWIDGKEMIKHSNRYESPNEDIEKIAAAKQRDALLGGKKKRPQVIPYNGDEKKQQKVYVKYPKYDRSNSEVTVKKVTYDIEAYLIEKYGERRIREERVRVGFMKARAKGYETII